MEWKRMIKIGYWWLFHILIFAAAALLFWDACKVRLDADPDARIWKQEQAAHVGQYEETIQGVIDQADQMSVISIFSREGSFSKSNIEKTREDALRLQGVDPQILSSPFAQYWLSWDLSDFLIPVLLFLAVLLFQQERREGMWELVRLTGREEEAFFSGAWVCWQCWPAQTRWCCMDCASSFVWECSEGSVNGERLYSPCRIFH